MKPNPKEQFKAELKNHTDTHINNIVGTLKGIVNQATDEFVEKVWPNLLNNVKKVLMEVEAQKLAAEIEAAKNKTPTNSQPTPADNNQQTTDAK